ncbi:hypothetical protein RM844_15400 [Streptomyces sp. DSM 44915]|uniref:Uncharacterized protein n=1 Tax=Streptomyces chisholmiae TaxID=3075540 RepID=A0ABU2JRT3_9ACTN|nr:hypothetical protein [Streptomyces sp. DSM 44915]MDT0267672.1 hypothetical protein [Streptomyces sp. DSM 44915]
MGDKFAVNYDLLLMLQREMNKLADEAEEGGASGHFLAVATGGDEGRDRVFGHEELSRQVAFFQFDSAKRTKEGVDGLRKFGNTFGSLAATLIDMDSQLATSASFSVASMGFSEWLGEKEAYESHQRKVDAWNGYLESIGAADYFHDHPEANIDQVCQPPGPDEPDNRPDWCDTHLQNWADDVRGVDGIDDRVPPHPGLPEDAPKPPTDEPPDRVEFSDRRGNAISSSVTYDSDYNIIAEESTVTLANGERYTTLTEYDGPPNIVESSYSLHPAGPGSAPVTAEAPAFDTRDYTVTSTSSDGTVTVEEVSIDDEGAEVPGAGTKTVTVTSVDDDGEEKTEVKEYTRAGPFEDWVEEGEEESGEVRPERVMPMV